MQVEKELLALFVTNVKLGSPQKRTYIFLTDGTWAILYCLNVDNHNTWQLQQGYDKIRGRIMHSRLAASCDLRCRSVVKLTALLLLLLLQLHNCIQLSYNETKFMAQWYLGA